MDTISSTIDTINSLPDNNIIIIDTINSFVDNILHDEQECSYIINHIIVIILERN
jgi:hypothetical protein